MLRKFMILSIVTYVLFGINAAFAQPSINSVSGVTYHKANNVVINGSDFGSKSPTAPRIWDACDDDSTNSLSTHWPGITWPATCTGTPGDTPYLMDYRTSFHGFSAMPHSRITKFISAACTNCSAELDNGGWASSTAATFFTSGPWNADTLFAMYYYRLSSTFSPSVVDGHPYYKGSDNLKEVSANGGNGDYLEGIDTYIDWCNGNGTPAGAGAGNTPYLKGGNPSDPSDCGCGSTEKLAMPNPMDGWVHMELFWDRSGYIVAYSNGASTGNSSLCSENRKKIHNADGENPAAISIGGFVRWPRTSVTGNYRYWAGLYLDDTYSRVMLGNNSNWDNCTIREPQIPYAWSDNSITITINQGALTTCETHYLFVFDADNNHNAVGYPISVCASTGEAPCPPTGLKIVQ